MDKSVAAPSEWTQKARLPFLHPPTHHELFWTAFGQSACSVAVSYKPPMLVTRVRLPACAVNLLLVFSKSAHLALAVQVPRSSPFLFAPTPHDPTLLGGCWLLLQLLGMRSANEPPVGIEPTTIRLRSACSASRAKEAYAIGTFQELWTSAK